MRKSEIIAVFLAGVTTIVAAGWALAQGPPSPGPTKPAPPPAAGEPRKDIVINPTEEECRSGWNPSLSWSREEFDGFCAKMKAAK